MKSIIFFFAVICLCLTVLSTSNLNAQQRKKQQRPKQSASKPKQDTEPPAKEYVILYCDGIVGQNIRLSEIVVSTKAEAEMILNKLKEGQSFSSLAIAYSTRPTSKRRGYIGEIAMADLRDEIKAAVKNIRPGDITGIIALREMPEAQGQKVDAKRQTTTLAEDKIQGLIKPANFCGICGGLAIGYCQMRRIYVCDTHRYFTQGDKSWRCP